MFPGKSYAKTANRSHDECFSLFRRAKDASKRDSSARFSRDRALIQPLEKPFHSLA